MTPNAPMIGAEARTAKVSARLAYYSIPIGPQDCVNTGLIARTLGLLPFQYIGIYA